MVSLKDISLYEDNVNPLNKPTALVALFPTVNPFKTLKFVQPSKKLSKDVVFIVRLFIVVNVLQLASLTWSVNILVSLSVSIFGGYQFSPLTMLGPKDIERTERA
jgi:hypothetical protein